MRFLYSALLIFTVLASMEATAQFISISKIGGSSTYAVGSSAKFKIKKLKKASGEDMALVVEATTTAGSIESIEVLEDRSNFTYRTKGLTANSVIKFQVYIENVKRSNELRLAIDRVQKQILELDRLIGQSSSPVLLAEREKLTRNLDALKVELAGKREVVQTQEFFLNVGPPSGQLDILSPVEGAIVNSSNLSVIGVADTNTNNVSIFVDGIEVPSTLPGIQFTSILRDYLQSGLNQVEIVAKVGDVVLSEKKIEFFYLPDGAAGRTVGVAGGEISVSDSSSSLFGMQLNVPPGATSEDDFVSINYGRGLGNPFEFGIVEVSPSISLVPMFKEFTNNVSLKMQIELAKFPVGVAISDVIVYGWNGEQWMVVPISSRGADFVTVNLSSFSFYDLVAVVDTPVIANQLRITSDIQGASIYIDGAFTGYTIPALISDLAYGNHNLKLYLEGYNEVFQTINFSQGQSLNLNFSEQEENLPEVALDPSLVNGKVVNTSTVAVSGSVAVIGGGPYSGKVVLSHNLDDLSTVVNSDGTFSFVVPLGIGNNPIKVRYTEDGKTRNSRSVNIIKNVASKNGQHRVKAETQKTPIRIIVTWDNLPANVDLNIFDETGVRVWWHQPRWFGGVLDPIVMRSGTESGTIEMFTMTDPWPGNYWLRVDNDSLQDYGPNNVTVKVYFSDKIVFEESRVMNSFWSWWAPFEFEVRDFKIDSLNTTNGPSERKYSKICETKYKDYLCGEYKFTSEAGDNIITVNTVKPYNVPSGSISYKVRELSRNLVVPVIQKGSTISFPAIVKPLTGLKVPVKSEPLIYEIIATAPGQRDTDPAYLVQDIKSRIRQEYVDKKVFYPGFAICDPFCPEYDSILEKAPNPTVNFYTYRKLWEKSDFLVMGLVGKSMDYANQINIAFRAKYPGRPILQLNSGWRNPRRNDQFLPRSSKDSMHQTGDSLDLVSHQLSDSSEIKDQLLMELCEVAFNATTDTDVIYHDWHVHVEPYTPKAGRIKKCKSNLKKQNNSRNRTSAT